MEQMNSKLSVKYEYKDVYDVKQQKEISISSEYVGNFNIHQIADFMLSVIGLTGHSTRRVLFTVIEMSDCVDDIADDLYHLGYGNQEKE